MLTTPCPYPNKRSSTGTNQHGQESLQTSPSLKRETFSSLVSFFFKPLHVLFRTLPRLELTHKRIKPPPSSQRPITLYSPTPYPAPLLPPRLSPRLGAERGWTRLREGEGLSRLPPVSAPRLPRTRCGDTPNSVQALFFFSSFQTHTTDALPGVSTPQNNPKNAGKRRKRCKKSIWPA